MLDHKFIAKSVFRFEKFSKILLIPMAAEQNLTEKSIHKSPKKVQELIGFHNQFLTQKANLIG